LDIHEAVYLTSKIKVKAIMTFPVITVPPDHTLQETAEILTKNDISGVPVVDDKGHIMGIITQRDILRALLSVISMDKTGYQFAFKIKDRPGRISDELIKVVHDHGGRIASIMTSYKKAPVGYRYGYIQVYNLVPEKLPQLIEVFKKKTSLLYVVDSVQDKKEVYGE
jgi:CBS-domain-containing membrane protein